MVLLKFKSNLLGLTFAWYNNLCLRIYKTSDFSCVFFSLATVNPLSLNFHQQILQSDLYLSIYFGRTRTDFISLSHSGLLAMTDARSCLERPLSLSSWSINVVFGRPLERLLCFGSQSVSWETVSFLLLQQWPLNCSRRIWRLVETVGKSL